MDRNYRQCLALSGVAQSAYMVKQLASHGMVGQDKLNTLVRSLLVTSPQTTVEVYGSVSRLNLGMQVLQEIVGNNDQDSSLKTPDVMRYFLGILHLERQLAGRGDMLRVIGERLERLEHAGLDSPDLATPELLQALATIYQETLSTLSFRVQVTGEASFLKNTEVAEKIRAVLLAGIRSAVLWQQSGGRRWHMFFKRKKINRDLHLLLTQVHEIH